MSGLAGLYGSRELPKAVKGRIDAIFTDAGSLPVGSTASAERLPNADRIKADLRIQEEAVIQSTMDAARGGAEIEGEKHLVFVTECGLQLPRWDDERDLARAASPVFDRVEYLTRFRVEGAATFPEDVKDIGVTLAASLARADKQTFVDVKARIDPATLHFEVKTGIFFGRVTVAVVPIDSSHAVIGGKYNRQVVYPEYNRETMELVRKIGIPYDARLSVPPETRFIRVIVYDAAADRVGSAGVVVR
jgi:hypothetical protein